jgi:hypothetical protein
MPHHHHQQQQQQQQQQEGGGGEQEEELGGATATAQSTDLSNITDFVSVGAGGNQLDSRAMRNLLLLHLRKVDVRQLLELPDYSGPAALSGVAAELAAAAPPAAGGVAQSQPETGGLWGDVALPRRHAARLAVACPLQHDSASGNARGSQQQQQQQHVLQPPPPQQLDAHAGQPSSDLGPDRGSAAAAAAAAAAGGGGGSDKPQKRLRFADD